jgi:hypothetical protein
MFILYLCLCLFLFYFYVMDIIFMDIIIDKEKIKV